MHFRSHTSCSVIQENVQPLDKGNASSDNEAKFKVGQIPGLREANKFVIKGKKRVLIRIISRKEQSFHEGLEFTDAIRSSNSEHNIHI